ncbi:BMP family lipoprotein [Halocalculus aciditolerans]|uniref:BMP family ABC transporter substrate-binding protein n=1 Tax=Halocalculus aciditolerans TaxID=1383812 RepID=A0A830FBR7_9EURY|nr:BMP family protein [Halocalculus aciditolerans]GGL59124.1 BMP family ABC transporter substrate-binding protein [Halocalculus aciditolerans]
MADFERRDILKTLGGAGTLAMTGLAGCSGGGGNETTTQSGGSESGDSEDAETTSSDPTNVGMVYALGGLGDKSFNDMAHRGVQEAEDEYGVSYQNMEPGSQSEISTLQRKLASSQSPSYELVTTVGYVQADALKTNAEQFPDQQFQIIDSVVDMDNVSSYTFKEHQGSFQVGYLAGLLSTQDFSAGTGSTKPDEKVVGFVGGKEVPLIQKFEAGYRAGVKHADDSIEVRAAYAGAYNDPATGKEIALSMFDEGADMVYHAAGGTGIGVFKAAQERGRFAFGVDSDQSKSASEYADVILASMVKRVNNAVFECVGNVVNDEFDGGSVHSLGLAEDGVACVYGAELGGDIPQSAKDKLATSKEQIASGEIEVPQKPENV